MPLGKKTKWYGEKLSTSWKMAPNQQRHGECAPDKIRFRKNTADNSLCACLKRDDQDSNFVGILFFNPYSLPSTNVFFSQTLFISNFRFWHLLHCVFLYARWFNSAFFSATFVFHHSLSGIFISEEVEKMINEQTFMRYDCKVRLLVIINITICFAWFEQPMLLSLSKCLSWKTLSESAKWNVWSRSYALPILIINFNHKYKVS